MNVQHRQQLLKGWRTTRVSDTTLWVSGASDDILFLPFVVFDTGNTGVTTPDSDLRPSLSTSEMPEVHEGFNYIFNETLMGFINSLNVFLGGNVPGSSGSSTKDSKVITVGISPPFFSIAVAVFFNHTLF